MKSNNNNGSFPLRHLSIRVPWHDSGWNGTVCKAPQLNGACAKLSGIADRKNEETEMPFAGRSLEYLSCDQWPCCVDERGMFMAPFEMIHIKQHALVKHDPKNFGHFQPTPQRYPAYSAGIIPFRWMMRENMNEYRNLLDLDIDDTREPEFNYNTTWVHEAQNQKSLLDGFAAHLREQDSLCFFYAKHVPFVERTGRILIGVGRINNIGPLAKYKGEGREGMIWDRPVQHSIRPESKEGFLLPYHEILQRAEQDTSLQIDRYVANVPDEHWNEFSYTSELVTHDGAIGALLSIDTAMLRIEKELGISTEWQRNWVNKELIRLWKVRGPFPGLGAVLTAFGITRGIFVAHALQQKAGENIDPWPLVDKVFNNPASVLPKELHSDLKELAPTWHNLPVERKKFLSLLSRFELTQPQATALYELGARRRNGWSDSDSDILKNPYRIYEMTRHHPEGVKLLTIDRGVFPEDSVRLQHPLPQPSALESPADLRRMRAFCIEALEKAASQGDSLLPKDTVVESVSSLPIRPVCPITGDILIARAKDMSPEIVPVEISGDMAIQLARYDTIGKLVRKQVEGRLKGRRHEVACDWATILDQKFGENADPEEKRARDEKAAALKELAESRFSVLIGPAGAGKTTVLGILCAQPEIQDNGLLLLAPTGKARVRMQQLAGGDGATAFTIAQFLNQKKRYDVLSGRYLMNDMPKADGYATVIVDEASMLTEDMLGALFDALKDVKRFIFVGDPAQLPPIGAGRPFVDIVSHLRLKDYESRFPRVTPGYAELTIERRQLGSERLDLRLARWFSSTPPFAGEDDVFCGNSEQPTIRFVEWKKTEDFQQRLLEVLKEELKLKGLDDVRGFNLTLGAIPKDEYDYFNATRNGISGAVKAVEDWQILSPLRGMPFGVWDMNRKIHQQFRAAFLTLASQQWGRSIPKPMGAERIVYGDKVINLSNHHRDGRKVFPQDGALGYLANGEIGIVVGQWKKGGYPKFLNVELTSQPGYTYGFDSSDFCDEGDVALELAYALTVHKSQGSQFKLVILVLPEKHPILSRELIYTAITRHQDRVVIMHQGPRTLLKEFSSPYRSETARRMTNLLQPCHMIETLQTVGSVFLQEGLIHRTSKRLAVRSKSELIIAEALANANITFSYEKPLTLGGITRYPDFTIEDEISGRTIYWEHLGMLERDDYRQSWEAKLSWYRNNGVLPANEGDGPKGTLVTTTESSTAGFDSSIVQKIIQELFGD